MSTLGPRQALFAQFAVVAKTLGHARRLELLEQLAQGERSVEALADRAGLSVANASQHLQLMMGAGVSPRGAPESSSITGSPTTAFSTRLLRCAGVAKRNIADVDRIVRSYFDKRDELEPVSRQQLLKLTSEGAVTVLDVRPSDEFALGHVSGAITFRCTR